MTTIRFSEFLSRMSGPLLGLLAVLLLLGLTSSACFSSPGPTLVIEKVEKESGFLTITFNAQGLFSPRILESLSRGLPATLVYEIRLWKNRRMWMDKLTHVNTLEYRIRYDPWEDGYRIQTKQGISPAVLDIVHVENSLCFHAKAIVGSINTMDASATYYVMTRAIMRPLSPEDVDEVESWLNDGQPGRRRGIRAVPGYLFDLIVGLSGLGDEAVSTRSQPFNLSELPSGGNGR